MMVIDPDTAPYDAESSEEVHKEPDEIGGVLDWYLDTFDPLEPDVAEAGNDAEQPTPIEAAELVTRSRTAPAWRRDDFPTTGPVRRSVWTPPYSLRPPDKEPEEGISLNQKTKDELRAKWKLRDPEYFEMERKATFRKHLLHCKFFSANCFLTHKINCYTMILVTPKTRQWLGRSIKTSSYQLHELQLPLSQRVNREGPLFQPMLFQSSNNMRFQFLKVRSRCLYP